MEQVNDEFKDMVEYGSNKLNLTLIIDGKTIGEGIKQIPSYICTLPYDGLNDLRKRFWGKLLF